MPSKVPGPVSSGPRVIVTRPEPQASSWVRQLQARGRPAVAVPLIVIEPVESPEPVERTWERLPTWQAVMFVSAEAVRHFFALATPEGRTAWQVPDGGPRAWCTGPGTQAALVAEGVAASRIDRPADDAPQWDSEALWARVGPAVRPGERILIVRGGDARGRVQGRDWLARQLVQAGAEVDECVAYRRRRPEWTPGERTFARDAAVDGSVWLFSSSEAVRNLAELCPGQDWSRAHGLATHPRIARAAREAGFGRVDLSRPAIEAVVGSIESIA